EHHGTRWHILAATMPSCSMMLSLYMTMENVARIATVSQINRKRRARSTCSEEILYRPAQRCFGEVVKKCRNGYTNRCSAIGHSISSMLGAARSDTATR